MTTEPITFDAFRASRRQVADLGAELSDSALTGVPGYLYIDAAYIEIDPDGKLLLQLANMGWSGENTPEFLAELEGHLFEWADGEICNVA